MEGREVRKDHECREDEVRNSRDRKRWYEQRRRSTGLHGETLEESGQVFEKKPFRELLQQNECSQSPLFPFPPHGCHCRRGRDGGGGEVEDFVCVCVCIHPELSYTAAGV